MLGRRRDSHHRAAGVMAGRRDHIDTLIAANCRAGRDNRRQNIVGDADRLHNLAVPILLMRIIQLQGRRFRKFAGLGTRQPIIEQIGNRQQSFGLFQQWTALADKGRQLKKSIERHELNAGALKNVAARHTLKRPFHDAICARIAVMNRIRQQFTGAIQQSVIDPPAIESNRRRPVGLGDAQPDFMPQTQRIPIESARSLNGYVGKAMNFPQLKGAAVISGIHHPSR